MRYCKACGQQLPFGEVDPIRWEEAVARKAAQAAETRAAQAAAEARKRGERKFTGARKRANKNKYPQTPSLNDL